MKRLNVQRTLVRELEEVLILQNPLEIKNSIQKLKNEYSKTSHELANEIQLMDCQKYLESDNA